MVLPVLAPPSWVHDEAKMEVFKTNAEKVIPDPAHYSAWFDRASERQRRIAVGSRRYGEVDKLTGGAASWAHFVDPRSGDLVPLKRLRTESKQEREARVEEVNRLIDERGRDIKHLSTYGFLPAEAPRLEKETMEDKAKRLRVTTTGITKDLPEYHALDSYVGSGYHDMNAYIREPRKRRWLPDRENVKRRVDDLKNLLARITPLTKPVTVYRGARFEIDDAKEFVGNLDKASTIAFHGFLSTTINEETADAFRETARKASIRFEIEAFQGLYVHPVIPHLQEQEFLMNDRTELEILGVQQTGEKEWIVKLRQIV